ncbi:MAG: zinc-dependent metalloprotease [Bacteroidales bacterium]|nr:zinc-dependent metalloprotease [Bacteroidales bacterium]
MRKLFLFVVITTFAYLYIGGSAFAAKSEKKNSRKKSKTEEVQKESAYKKITGRDSLVMNGVVNVIAKGDTFYLEIPVDLLGRQFLVVNRMQQVQRELNVAGINKGIAYQNQTISFEKDDKFKNVTIRQERTTPEVSNKDAVNKSVKDNYINPIIARIKIESLSPDSQSVIIKVNDLFNGTDNCINDVYAKINLGTPVQSNLSRIVDIKSFEKSLTATAELTTKVSEGTSKVNITTVVSSTLTLLPEKPMMAREEINRVGYFSTRALKYSDTQQSVEHKRYITRWRLEPSDKEAYMRGELVEPIKPIEFYIDPAMPSQLIPYIKEGILEWNVAFEKAGFKNAISVKDFTDSIATEGDDMKYSVFTHAASTKANAMGPSTIDPRSGEILEADIIWWHNVQSLLKEWIMVQTSAINPEARSFTLPEYLMGDAARFVACHEVGHSLGLRHNMRASAAYSVDSLRSASFTDRIGGTSASIMDYARFNYIAQPEDGVKIVSPHIGAYDLMAIEWGYRWFPTEEEAKVKLDEFLKKHDSPLYRYSETQSARTAIDPRAMSEDLGDNAMEAARLGIKNLKRIVPNIVEWTKNDAPSQTYDDAAYLYSGVIFQWSLYQYHVLANIGGMYLENTIVGDGQKTYTYVEKERQKDALQFLIDEVFTYPEWLYDADVLDYTYVLRNTPLGVMEQHPHISYRNQYNYMFWDLLNNERLYRMLENEYKNGEEAFSAYEMMDMLHKHIFAKTIKGQTPDIMERAIQKSFIDALITSASEGQGIKINKSSKELYEKHPILESEHQTTLCCQASMEERGLSSAPRLLLTSTTQIDRESDVLSIKRGELMDILKLLKSKSNTTNKAVKLHYQDIIMRIQAALGLEK